MVLGEPQILGQMKDAVRAAEQAGSLGTLLHQLFQRTFSVAKEVRSQTAIGAHSVSMAAAAVRLAERVFGDLSQRSEEHTSELQSLMRISYAVFCLKKKQA